MEASAGTGSVLLTCVASTAFMSLNWTKLKSVFQCSFSSSRISTKNVIQTVQFRLSGRICEAIGLHILDGTEQVKQERIVSLVVFGGNVRDGHGLESFGVFLAFAKGFSQVRDAQVGKAGDADHGFQDVKASKIAIVSLDRIQEANDFVHRVNQGFDKPVDTFVHARCHISSMAVVTVVMGDSTADGNGGDRVES